MTLGARRRPVTSLMYPLASVHAHVLNISLRVFEAAAHAFALFAVFIAACLPTIVFVALILHTHPHASFHLPLFTVTVLHNVIGIHTTASLVVIHCIVR